MARSTLTPAGILVPDSRISTATLSSTDSTYEQAGPKAGGASALPSGAVVALEGEQAEDIIVSAARGGPPLPTGGARLTWRPADESDDYGWAPPTWHGWSTGTTSLDESDVLDAVWLQSGALLVAVGRGTAADTACARWTPSTDTWADGGDLPYTATAPSGTLDAGVLLLRQADDGTVYAIVSDTDSPTERERIYLVSSTDDGDTWATVGECGFVGGTPAYGVKGRWWLTASGTHVMVLIGTDDIQTWTSEDGTQWALAGTLTGIYSPSSPYPMADVQMTASGHLLYVYAADTDTDKTVCRRCSPTQDPNTAAEVTVYAPGSGNVVTDVCILATQTGRVYVWIYHASVTTVAYWTDDDGATWAGSAGIAAAGDNTQGDLRRAVAVDGGFAVVRADWLSATNTGQAHVYVVGGWDTFEPAPVLSDNIDDDGSRLTWGTSPAALGWQGMAFTPGYALTSWTTSTTGAPTIGATGVTRTISSTSGQAEYYEYSSGGGRSAVVFVDVACTGGGSTGQLRVGWKLQTRLAASTNVKVECRITPTAFRLTDASGATLATVSRDMSTQRTQMMCVLETGNRVEVYYRTPGAPTWTSAYQSASPATAALTGDFLFQWGHIVTSGGTTCSSSWRFVAATRPNQADSTTAKDDQWSSSQSTDTARQRLLGRPLSGYGGSLGSSATLPKVSGREVLAVSDTATLSPRYAYPIEAIDVRRSPSPRRTWRSTSATLQYIAWELDPTYSASMRCLGIYIANANFRTATLQYHDGATWTNLVGLDLRHGTFDLVRSGTTVTTTTTDLAWLQQGEAVGGAVYFASLDVRTITANDAGQGDTSWRLTCADIDGTESTASSGYVRLPQGFAFHFAQRDIRRLRLSIPTQDTPEGFFEMGALVIGQVYAVGPQEWGTAETSTPDVQTYELPGYQLRARRSPPARRWGVEWPMQSLSTLRTTATDAPFYAPDGAATVRYGLQNATYQLLRGLVEEGADAVPVVFLPAMSTADEGTISGSTATELRRDVLWYAYAADVALSATVIVGDEGTDELLRVGRLTLEEIV